MSLRRKPQLLDAFDQPISATDEMVCVCGFTAAQDIGEITVTAGTIHRSDSDVVQRLPRYFVPVATSEDRRLVAFARITGATA
jgi:hypothetical protein